MELYKIRSGTLEELKNKNYTIGVGVSLGNKWFTVENILELTKWSLPLTKDKVIIYVADSIHAINLEVRNGISFDLAHKKANEMGDKILSSVKERIDNELPDEEKNKIIYVKWNEIVDNSYNEKVSYLYGLYENNTEFYDTIKTLVRSFTSKEEKEFSDKEISRLGEYIIEEIPEVICRVPMKGVICDAFVYPYDGELVQFTEKIQKGEIFPEIKETILDTKPKVFIEVR